MVMLDTVRKTIMMTKMFSGWLWKAISPSEYELVGRNAIRARFNGSGWHLVSPSAKVESVEFESMEQLAKAFDILVANWRKEKKNGH